MFKVYAHKSANDIIVVELEGKLTMDDIRNLNREVYDSYLSDTSKIYYLIFNLENVESFPNNIVELSKASNLIGTAKNVAIQAIVGSNNSIINFLVTVLSNLLGGTITKGKNINDAVEIFARHRSKRVKK